MKKILLFILFPFFLNAQLGNAGNGNPPGIKWKELSNESARIIFPKGLESRASRVADVIDYLNKNNRTSIGKSKGKINIVLQNQLTIANGFVTAAPFRSELFTTAPQRSFAGTNDWLDLLALHEYRHVMQMQFAKQGATKIGSFLLGDIGWIGMGFMSIPFWFTEGDAVMQETLLSEGGRGRAGSFLKEYRAMHEAGVKYPYSKMRNGSYKRILPNRYKMGYLISQYGRNKYGNDFWKNISKDAVRYKGLVWPFAKSVKRNTGKKISDLYEEVIDSVYQKWDLANKKTDWQQADEILVNKQIPKNKITYYLNPKFMGNKIVALREGRDRIPAFYTISLKGKEKKLFNLGHQDSYFNYNNDKIVWTQRISDIRWKNKMFSDIYIYDVKTKKKKRLTKKTKFFSPDINSNGTKILVVNSDELMQYKINILDAKNGKVIQTIPNPNNVFLSSPKWYNSSSIIAVSQHNQKNALVKIDIQTGKITPIIDYTHNLILRPVVYNNYIFFSADFTDIRNVFAVDLKTKEVFQITNSKVWASHPDISKDGKYLVYAEQQINGTDIKKIELNKSNWKPISITEPINRYPELNDLAKAENGNILNKIPKQKYNIKDYNHLKESIKVHSWYPIIGSINTNSGYGLGLNSTNLLSTLDIGLSGIINSYGEFKLGTSISWNKYYPKLSLNYDISQINFEHEDVTSKVISNFYYTSIKIPFDFSRGAMNTELLLKTSIGYRTYNNLSSSPGYTPNDHFLMVNSIIFQNKRVKATKQINPRFGQELSLQFTNKNNEFGLSNKMPFSISTKLYFPGLYRTHSFTVGGYYHENGTFPPLGLNNYGVRGEKKQSFSTNQVFMADYSFPIAYPDFNISSISFVKRIRANVFFDYGINSFNNKGKNISSIGVDLITDIGFFNFGRIAEFPIDIRISYLNETDYKWNYQFIFNKIVF